MQKTAAMIHIVSSKTQHFYQTSVLLPYSKYTFTHRKYLVCTIKPLFFNGNYAYIYDRKEGNNDSCLLLNTQGTSCAEYFTTLHGSLIVVPGWLEN